MTKTHKEKQLNLADLKMNISEAIVNYRSKQLDCDASEYGAVYNSEAHEALLNLIVRIVDSSYDD